jgi:asparagine synthase (glutamine-hydrolysing)
VVLTGLGGNLTASWDGMALFAELVRRGAWFRAFREARALAREGGTSHAGRILVALGVLPLLPPAVGSAARRSWRALAERGSSGWSGWSLVRPEFAEEQSVEERTRGLPQGVLDRSLMSPASARALVLGLGSGGSFEAGVRSHHGVDLRHPLFDVRLLDFCLGIPEEQFLRNGRSRWLVRRAMEGRLPAEVLLNRRRGLQAADWYESLAIALPQVREQVALFRRDDLIRRALDLPRLERLLNAWPEQAWGDPRVATEYSGALGRAMMAGCFVEWAQAQARREAGVDASREP